MAGELLGQVVIITGAGRGIRRAVAGERASAGAGRLGMAGSAADSASKFGVIGFTEAVGLEVRETGVKVSVVEPGSVQTTFSDRAARWDWALQPDDVARVVRAVLATGPNVWIREAFVTPLRVPKA